MKHTDEQIAAIWLSILSLQKRVKELEKIETCKAAKIYAIKD